MKTVNELLKAWDQGQSIWSIELGGLGPGYEQAIQVTAVEVARELRKLKRTRSKREDWEAAKKIRDEVIHRIDRTVGGLSGAQGKFDDCIQVDNFWPHAPKTKGSK